MLTPGLATSVSLSESFYRSRLTFPNALNSQRRGSCHCIAYKPSPACLGRNRVQTSRRVMREFGGQARQRPLPVSAAVAEQDLGNQASEGVNDTSHVQPFLEWLAIQGCVVRRPVSECQYVPPLQIQLVEWVYRRRGSTGGGLQAGCIQCRERTAWHPQPAGIPTLLTVLLKGS